MRTGLVRFFLSSLSGCLLASLSAGAQQMPPAEPPLPMPSAHADTPTLRVTANEVLVPTLVEKHDGEVVYGLKPADFVLEDNGVADRKSTRLNSSHLGIS